MTRPFDYPNTDMPEAIDIRQKTESSRDEPNSFDEHRDAEGLLKFEYPATKAQWEADQKALKIARGPNFKPENAKEKGLYYPSLDGKKPVDYTPKGWGDESDADDLYPDDPADLNDPQGDADEIELIELADSGNVNEFADRISEDLLEMGASQKDLDMVNYFREVADGNDPAWQKWGRDMALWIRRSKKAMGK